jgi:hypothetical protein
VFLNWAKAAIETPFVAAYELETDVDLPGAGDGPAQFFYPGGLETASVAVGSSDLLLKIMPINRQPWLANFSGDDYPFTTVTTCPDPDSFCAVAHGLGYVVKANNPRNWSEVRALPILQVFPDEDHELLLFADFTRIAAYAKAGPAWLADLVLDGLKILSRTGTELRIRGDTYDPGSEEQLVIDVLTGEVIELPCGHRNWTPFIKPYPGRKCLVCGERRLDHR